MLCICNNTDGIYEVPLSVIIKAHSYCCFNNYRPNIKYYIKRKTCTNANILTKWWNDFLAHIRKDKNEKFLIIMDNCGTHGTELKYPMEQVKFVLLHTKITGVYQTMDTGTVTNINKNYWYRLLCQMLLIYVDR